MKENIEKLKQIINDNKELNGFFTQQELFSWNISINDINFLLENNIIEKIDDDIYCVANQFFDFYYYINIVVKNSVFSCEPSSFLNTYSDNSFVETYFLIVPKEVEKSVVEKLKTKFKNNFIIKVENKEIYELGIVEIETPFGSKVKSYDKEKTLCDFIKYKKEVEFDTFLQYVENYFSWWKKDKDINPLLAYANKMGLENDVRFIIENWKDLDLLKQYHQLSKTN